MRLGKGAALLKMIIIPTSSFNSTHNMFDMGLGTVLEPSKNPAIDDVFVFTALLCSLAVWLLRGISWDKPNPYRYLLFQRPQEKNLLVNTSMQKTRNIAEELEDSGMNIVIFWGSQSGTGEAFANRLGRECHSKFGLDALVADISDYDPVSIELLPSSKLAIFILSTYGEGDPSDNAQALWNWTKTSIKPQLPHLQFVALGLGNSNYKSYNLVVDCVSEFFRNCGATELMPTFRANDAAGNTEEDFMTWKDLLFHLLVGQLGYTQREAKYMPIVKVEENTSLPLDDFHPGQSLALGDSKWNSTASSTFYPVYLQDIKLLFESPSRSCLHLDMDLSKFTELKYTTGDHLGVLPINPDVEIDRLLKALGLYDQRDVPISISSLLPDVEVKIPSPTTADILFRYYLEICAPVSRDTLAGLVEFAPTPSVKQQLATLAQEKGAYTEFLRMNPVTIGRILEKTTGGTETWKKLPLSFLVESISALRPRYYSISSSSIVQPRQPSITVAVSTVQQGVKTCIEGLNTHYLLAVKDASTAVGDSHPLNGRYQLDDPSGILASGKLNITIRKSRFKLPLTPTKPVIMIAAGTGLAPFRGFLQERARLKQIGWHIGRTILFLGCRNAEEFPYRDELVSLETQLGKDVFSLITAFSRSTGDRVYVQNRVKEHAEELHTLLHDENANLYICGSAVMAREVKNVFETEMIKKFGWAEEEVRSLKNQRARWQEDVWG